MSVNHEVLALIKKLYGNQAKCVRYLTQNTDSIPTVMGKGPRNQRELHDIKKNHYRPIKAAEDDSHRFSYNDLGYPKDAINNAKQDIHDIKTSKSMRESDDYQADIKFDQNQIHADEKFPSNEMVLIDRLNNGHIVRSAKPIDVEMIYHNTHYSEREIVERHPKILAYTTKDAEADAKTDLKRA